MIRRLLRAMVVAAIVANLTGCARLASAAIALDSAGTIQFQEALGNTLTFSHTCTGASILVVHIGVRQLSGETITGVTYNGVAMTEAVENDPAINILDYLYYINSPAAGAHNVVITATGATYIAAVATSWSGTDTSASYSTTDSSISGAGTISVSPSTVTGEVVVDVVAADAFSSGCYSITQGGSQTAIGAQCDTDEVIVLGASYRASAAGSSLMSWGVSDNAVQSAMVLSPAASATLPDLSMKGVSLKGVAVR